MTTPMLAWDMTPVASSQDQSGLLVLLPSLGTTTVLWDKTVAGLRAAHLPTRILRIDLPGHGASPVARSSFSMSDLATATLGVIDRVGGGTFCVAGDSMGGCVSLELALLAPERVRGLAMFCSGSRIGTPDTWTARAELVRRYGTAALIQSSPARWFSPRFLDGPGGGRGRQTLQELALVDAESYALCAEALSTFDRSADLSLVRTPSLIVAGADDSVTSPGEMLALANALPIADFCELPNTAHLAPLEQPTATARLLGELVGVGNLVYG